MALTNGVVDWGLTILILVVNEIATLIAEVLNDLVIGFSRSVEERSLLKCIFSAGVHSQLDQHCDHLEGNLGVWNDASRENR